MGIENIRAKAARGISPLKAADATTSAPKDLLLSATRTNAGRGLPPYYLVYFLLVDLLGFRNLGRWEKTAWSVPLDLNGKAYLVEHRKSGLGRFAADTPDAEGAAAEVVRLISKGIRAAALSGLARRGGTEVIEPERREQGGRALQAIRLPGRAVRAPPGGG